MRVGYVSRISTVSARRTQGGLLGRRDQHKREADRCVDGLSPIKHMWTHALLHQDSTRCSTRRSDARSARRSVNFVPVPELESQIWVQNIPNLYISKLIDVLRGHDMRKARSCQLLGQLGESKHR